MKNTIHLGFVAIILMMVILSIAWLFQIKSSNDAVLDLIKDNGVKIGHVHTMATATRARQVRLLSMLVIDDAFELDDEITKFYEEAYSYRKSREALYLMSSTEEEKSLQNKIDAITSVTQPLSNKIVGMYDEQIEKTKIAKAMDDVRSVQDKLFSLLDEFVILQKKYDDATLNYSRKQFDNDILWGSGIGFIFVIIAILIGRYVSGYVVEKNTLLKVAGEEMGIAFKKSEEATIIKSEFLATMSHEIRTPLTAIIGFAESTSFSEQTMEQRNNSIQVIIRSGKHLLQIINDILDLSKVEENKLDVESIELPLFELLNDIDRLVRPTAEEKGLRFTINYIYPLPEKIVSDPLRVKQVLINLCNNAIKFTEKGHVLINVRCGCDKDNNRLSFEVVDSGIGMTSEQMDLVFQAYRQADSSTTRKYGGTGLGLSLSSLLAERLGGSITVESEVNKGSLFKFALSIEIPAETEIVFDKEYLPKIQQATIPVSTTKHLSGHILLAEDNEDNQQLLLMYLKRMGVDVTIVENGELAVKAIKENDFDLILMDMRMPVMGGLEAIEILRKQNFKKPIVALTANAMQEDKDACYKAGCNDFLTKPVDVVLLNETIEKFLKIKPAEKTNKVAIVSSLLDEGFEAIDLVKRFVGRLADTLKDIEQSMGENDWDKLSDILHQLKGTSGNYGYPKLASLAGKMEFQVINKNKDELMKLFSQLKESHQQILEGIKSV